MKHFNNLENINTHKLNDLILNKFNNAKIFIKKNNQIKKILKKIRDKLDSEQGYVILDIDSKNSYNLKQKKNIYLKIGKCLGKVIKQNIKGETLVRVFNKGKGTIRTGARYHETNDAGSLHTDSPQWTKTPKYIALLNIRSAIEGGENLLINSYLVKKIIEKKDKKLLKTLFSSFHFDKRGEFKKNEKPTTYKPIFIQKKNKLYFRYLREYIDAGHQRVGQKLSSMEIKSLNLLDSIINNPKLSKSIDLKPGQCLIINNNHIAHGRTKFKDHRLARKKRLYLRLWIA